MPVLATMIFVALFGDRSSPPLPFFDADLMAELLEDNLDEADTEAREAALRVTEGIRREMSAYREQVVAGVAAYQSKAESAPLDVDALEAALEAYDQRRTDILLEVVRYRRELIGLLDEEQWTNVFD